MKVAASGGTPVAATSFDEGAGDSSHRFPIFLPDGRRFLFAVGVANEALSFRIVAGSLDRAGERHELTESAFAPRFAAPRHLIYGRDEATLVRELDLDRLELVGEPRLLAETPDTSVYVLGTPPVDVASTGAMVYAALDGRPTEFVELGASGDPVASLREGGDFLVVAPSRGGRIAALRAAGAGQSLWVVDPTRATATRLTAAGRSHNGAAWSADGRELAAFLTSGGGTKLVWLDAESGRERELLDTGGRWILPIDASRDGRYLLAGETTAAQRLNLVYLRLDAAPVLTPYLESPAEESTGALSPDARWIAYVSDASGRAEAYVDRFPEPAGARRVAVSGEVQRVFWPRQDELVFLTSDGDRRTAYASRVTFEPDLRVEPPRRRLDFAGELRGLTVGEDGRFRFGRAVGERPPALTLVQGWTRQLEAAP
jgi:hypothetical protein